MQGEREARLLSNILRSVVSDFVPLGVRIFVLPFHFYDRLWNEESKRLVTRSSWVARTIDNLSLEHDIVFVLISGNISSPEIGLLHSEKTYPAYLLEDRASIADPGQAALAVTVGAIAHSASVVASEGTPIALESQPSPFARTGWGIRGSVKPDFVEYGGNAVIQEGVGWAQRNIGTDVVMASNMLTPPIQHNSGTSFSAPRVAHHLALIHQDLSTLVPNHTSCLLKAFLGNSATWPHETGPIRENAQSIVETLGGKDWLRVYGLGNPGWERALYCDDYSAVLYFDGHISPDAVAYFSIPVTAELTGSKGQKRLTVSLCYAPPVQRWGLEDYLGVRLKFRLFRGDVDPIEIEESMSEPEMDNDDDNSGDEVRPNELTGRIGINLRSRSTLQHDIFEWTRHQEEHSEHNYTLAVVASKAKWGGGTPPPVKLAVVVRLEDLSRSVAQVYSSVARANAEIRVQAGA